MASEVKVKSEPDATIGTIKQRWDKLDGKRFAVLERGRQCAELTIPALLPPVGHTESNPLPTPYQGLGARGVNNLASKLLLALLPPNSPFFRMVVDDFTLEQLTGGDEARAEVEKALNKIERAVMDEMESSASRVPCFTAIKYLVSIGNALLYLPDLGGLKVYRLDRYVVKRDPMGAVLEIIIKESISQSLLPKDVPNHHGESKGVDDDVDLFTRIHRKGNMWEVCQEANGVIIPKSQGKYPLDECPWIPLRWTAVDGEDYGRGLVEEYLGDLRSLEALSMAIVEGSAAAAKVLFLVNPNGTTRAKTISEAENGAVKNGNAADVTVLQMNKFNDFKVALETITKIEQRLSQAFLLVSSIQRQAERVTAEEIRQMVSELEDALGGVYSVLSQEMQLPLVKQIMKQMTKKKTLPPLPKTIKPVITTGLEALGRGHDLSTLGTFLQELSPLGPQVIQAYLNVGDYITRVATALGMDTGGLVKSDQEVQQAQQQAQQAQMMQSIAPGAAAQAVKGVADHINNRQGAT